MVYEVVEIGLQYTPYTLPLLSVAFLAVAFAYLGWRDGTSGWLVSTIFSLSLWSLFLVLQLTVTNIDAKLAFNALVLASALLLSVSWFLFALAYTGRTIKTWHKVALLSVPLTDIFVNFLFYYVPPIRDIGYLDIGIVNEGGIQILQFAKSPIWWLYVVFAYLMLFGGMGLILQMFLGAGNLYKKQALFLVVGVGLPWLGNLASVLGYSPFPHFMLAPFIFPITGILIFLGLYRYDFVNIAPKARNLVMEEFQSGIILLDHKNRVVDINPVAERIIGDRDAIGKNVSEVLEDFELDMYTKEEKNQEITLEVDGEERYFNVRSKPFSTPIHEQRDHIAGHIVMINDITEIRERESELERQNERLDNFASLVSHDLRNPLNVAQGYAEMLDDKLENRLDGEMENPQELEEIRESHERMAEIIDDVLMLTRQGSTVEETHEVSLEDASREAWNNVDTVGADLEVEEDVSLRADRGRLLQMF
ncbi:MAG: histidine kinase N-terminal 7TM domain-containing protein, partial [Halobacteria archaeon]|nr:histidine kinase N-terminal 7TM domain-containing protein [Halobacteria archaeon]